MLRTIERWVASRGQKGPAERDSKKVEAYLLRLVDPDQGLGGIEMVVECLKWMRLILAERHGQRDSVSDRPDGESVAAGGGEGQVTAQESSDDAADLMQARRDWWATWDRFRGNVSQRVYDILGAPLVL